MVASTNRVSAAGAFSVYSGNSFNYLASSGFLGFDNKTAQLMAKYQSLVAGSTSANTNSLNSLSTPMQQSSYTPRTRVDYRALKNELVTNASKEVEVDADAVGSGSHGGDTITLTSGGKGFGSLGNDSATGVSNNFISTHQGNDTITTTGSNNFISGGSGDDVIVLSGGSSNTVYAGVDDDTVTLTGSISNTIDGGDGQDTVSLDNTFASYTITDNEDGTYTFTDSSGSNTVTNFEAYQFTDQTLTHQQVVDSIGAPAPPPPPPPPSGPTSGDDTITITGDGSGATTNALAGNDTFSVDNTATDHVLAGGDGTDLADLTDTNFADYTVTDNGTNVVLTHNTSGHTITINNDVETIEDSTGTQKTFAQVQALAPAPPPPPPPSGPTSGDDTITITGDGSGATTNALAGNDTFSIDNTATDHVLAGGDGTDLADLTDTNFADYTVTDNGTNVVLTHNTSGNTITINNDVETIEDSTGTQKTFAQVQALAPAPPPPPPPSGPTSGDDTITITGDGSGATTNALAGNDTFSVDNTATDHVLAGGDGTDLVDLTNTNFSNYTVIDNGSSVVLTHNTSGNTITINNDVETIEDGTGTQKTFAQVQALAPSGMNGTIRGSMNLTNYNDTATLDGDDATINTYSGADILTVLDGSSRAVIDMGDGDDYLNYGNADDAVITMGNGNDTINFTSQYASDLIIDMGAGNDTIYQINNDGAQISMGDGDDTYVLTANAGGSELNTIDGGVGGSDTVDFTAFAGGGISNLDNVIDNGNGTYDITYDGDVNTYSNFEAYTFNEGSYTISQLLELFA